MAKPIAQIQAGVAEEIGGGDESLARRRAAAELVATAAKDKSEGLGAMIAGALPSVLSAAGTAGGTMLAGPAGGAAGGAIGTGVGKLLSSVDTSQQELQSAEQDLENIKAAQEGRAARQVQSKQSQAAMLGQGLGGILGAGISAYAKGTPTLESSGVQKVGL
jgi:hypothetical protein